ncbi:hypothetical protein [Bythopirellula goksoeyrii]|uniref:Uncharacterized protein n=1 Tax=Bythopirellula goksoeyrii TaxID=1400387 RepID=A0A5B9Q4B6_9BACT|nr:hypothetical protein [Bythopirellula goksoeyrii]QEG33868.1 hypothetical protein Pr1d_11380 [Bythopirellula goksoeyrii]
MAKLATCPGCTTQLALPEEATLSDEARCPRCGDEFPLMEVVQFSIPTAELIPASERSPSSEIAEWAAKTMELGLDQDNQSVEETIDAAGSGDGEIEPPASEVPDANLTTTLSDWEARLKRAISDTESAEADDPASESDDQASSVEPLQTETKLSDTLKDFSFPHEDLEPVSRDAPLSPAQQSGARDAPEPSSASWAEVEADEFEFDSAEPTVKTMADSTIANYAVPSEPEVEIAISNSTEPRKKNSRSFVRTLLSASLGVIGIPLGLYALLWIKGPAADVAHLADYLPSFMLPASMQSTVPHSEQNATALALEESVPLPSGDNHALPPIVADPEVQPAAAEAPVYNGPRFELVESEDFSQLMTAAAQAAPELTTGTLAEDANNRRKGNAYMALCRLADKCSFMNQPGLSDMDADHATEAQELLESVLSDSEVLVDLSHIAGTWWKFKARPSSGIVFTGRVEHVENTPIGALAEVQLGETGAVVPVLVGGQAPHLGGQIGVVGSIVNDPSSSIPALSELSEPIVVAHFSVPLAGTFASDAFPTEAN